MSCDDGVVVSVIYYLNYIECRIKIWKLTIQRKKEEEKSKKKKNK